MKLHHMSFLVGAAIGAFALDSCHHAHAESFLQAEIGLGVQQSRDSGDGVWVQRASNIPHQEQMRSPAFLVGATGDLWTNGTIDLRYHADYVYFGTISASCQCVPDVNYDPVHSRTVGNLPRLSPFNGSGHTQGLALTLDTGYTWHGYRLALEAGPWLYFQTWHESLYALDNQWHNLSHHTTPQLGYVVGARIERASFGLSYRYYGERALSNPYPAMATGTHMLMATWRF